MERAVHYLTPGGMGSDSTTTVWGYLGHRFDCGASGVCTRCMRRYGSVWCSGNVRVLNEPSAGRDACMS